MFLDIFCIEEVGCLSQGRVLRTLSPAKQLICLSLHFEIVEPKESQRHSIAKLMSRSMEQIGDTHEDMIKNALKDLLLPQ